MKRKDILETMKIFKTNISFKDDDGMDPIVIAYGPCANLVSMTIRTYRNHVSFPLDTLKDISKVLKDIEEYAEEEIC